MQNTTYAYERFCAHAGAETLRQVEFDRIDGLFREPTSSPEIPLRAFETMSQKFDFACGSAQDDAGEGAEY